MGTARLVEAGLIGAIVSRTCFFLKTFTQFREEILDNELDLFTFADLGLGVLEAMVETAAATWIKRSLSQGNSLFVRLLSERNNKAKILENSITDMNRGSLGKSVFFVKNRQFNMLAESPFVYWVESEVIDKLKLLETIDPAACSIRVGLQTGDDYRFLRLWSEIPFNQLISARGASSAVDAERICLKLSAGQKIWAWYSKTEVASPFIASIHMCVNWQHLGAEIKAYHQGNGHSPSKYVMSEDHYFRPGFSYMLRSVRLVPYVVPSGTIPTAGRSQVYPKAGLEDWLLILLASNLATAVARFRAENYFGPKFQNSMVGNIPFIIPTNELLQDGIEIVKQQRGRLSQQFQVDESEILFLLPPIIVRDIEFTEINRQCLLEEDFEIRTGEAFGLSPAGFDSLASDLKDAVSSGLVGAEISEDAVDNADNFSKLGSFSALLAYFVGCVFGRWDIRYATGERSVPDLPDPFAPLPVCPPGQLQNTNGLPAQLEDVTNNYPLKDIPWDGILVDDPNHPLDIEGRVREVIDIIWKDRSDSIEHEACEILGVKKLRDYFRKPSLFFADHLKRYSKSRRQAPIYWPLSTASGGYTLWIYYHRLDDQTLYTCVNNFVQPKLDELERQVNALKADKKTKELADVLDFQAELEEFKRELLAWAPRWKPNLNDGVIITAAPLYRLFRLPKWRKDLEACWKALELGDYDWAHLAFTLWPERVREKCRADKSLAIAHGLEGLYVEPVGMAGKKKKAAKVFESELELSDET
jgi:hypothetical protein